jgi:hypothetical protein
VQYKKMPEADRRGRPEPGSEMHKKYLGAFAAGIVMACASAGTPGGVAAHDANLITRAEIASISATNAYDAVERLRPQFFRSHGSTSYATRDPGLPTVYLNKQRYGDISTLKQIDVGAIREIRYYSPAQATNRFSVGSPSGAIEVITDLQ